MRWLGASNTNPIQFKVCAKQEILTTRYRKWVAEYYIVISYRKQPAGSITVYRNLKPYKIMSAIDCLTF